MLSGDLVLQTSAFTMTGCFAVGAVPHNMHHGTLGLPAGVQPGRHWTTVLRLVFAVLPAGRCDGRAENVAAVLHVYYVGQLPCQGELAVEG